MSLFSSVFDFPFNLHTIWTVNVPSLVAFCGKNQPKTRFIVLLIHTLCLLVCLFSERLKSYTRKTVLRKSNYSIYNHFDRVSRRAAAATFVVVFIVSDLIGSNDLNQIESWRWCALLIYFTENKKIHKTHENFIDISHSKISNFTISFSMHRIKKYYHELFANFWVWIDTNKKKNAKNVSTFLCLTTYAASRTSVQ